MLGVFGVGFTCFLVRFLFISGRYSLAIMFTILLPTTYYIYVGNNILKAAAGEFDADAAPYPSFDEIMSLAVQMLLPRQTTTISVVFIYYYL